MLLAAAVILLLILLTGLYVAAEFAAVGALLLTGLMRNLLYGVQPSDPLTFVLVATVLGGVAAFAASVPGLRATRVDPVVALRTE